MRELQRRADQRSGTYRSQDKDTRQDLYRRQLDLDREFEAKEINRRHARQLQLEEYYQRQALKDELAAAQRQQADSATQWGKLSGQHKTAQAKADALAQQLEHIEQRINEQMSLFDAGQAQARPDAQAQWARESADQLDKPGIRDAYNRRSGIEQENARQDLKERFDTASEDREALRRDFNTQATNPQHVAEQQQAAAQARRQQRTEEALQSRQRQADERSRTYREQDPNNRRNLYRRQLDLEQAFDAEKSRERAALQAQLATEYDQQALKDQLATAQLQLERSETLWGKFSGQHKTALEKTEALAQQVTQIEERIQQQVDTLATQQRAERLAMQEIWKIEAEQDYQRPGIREAYNRRSGAEQQKAQEAFKANFETAAQHREALRETAQTPTQHRDALKTTVDTAAQHREALQRESEQPVEVAPIQAVPEQTQNRSQDQGQDSEQSYSSSSSSSADPSSSESTRDNSAAQNVSHTISRDTGHDRSMDIG